MIAPKLLLTCNINETQLYIEDEIASSMKTNTEIAECIDELWLIKQQEATSQGRKLWNSTAYRLERFWQTGDSLHLQLSTVEYKEIMARRAIEALPVLGEDYFTWFVFVASLIHTSDNMYVFGKVGRSYTDLKIDLIGGGVNKDEGLVKNGSDFFGVLYKEFKEEINLDSTDIVQSMLRGILLSPWYGIGCIFYTKLRISSSEVVAKFQQENDGELQTLVLVESENVETFLGTLGGYKPLINQIELSL